MADIEIFGSGGHEVTIGKPADVTLSIGAAYVSGGGHGVVGEKGEKGDRGERGEQGIQGIQGERGEKGERGERGEQGERGLQGIPGIRGEKGEKGDPGERGLQGAQGERGLPGERGPQGDDGAKGEPGIQGERGLPGIQGIKGEKGDRGAPGAKGDPGDKGEKGEPGAPGRDGIDGKDGKPGTTDYNQLENKPDLSGMATTEYVDRSLSGKVDSRQSRNIVYGNDDDGHEASIFYTAKNDKGTVVWRDENDGTIGIGDPAKPEHATTKKYVDEALDNKLDKNSTINIAYVNDDHGKPSTLPYRVLPHASTIPMRNNKGNIEAEDPTERKHVATKQYVDKITESVTSVKNTARTVPTDAEAALLRTLRANRMAFVPPEQVTVEISNNNGTTWTTRNTSDRDKRLLFAGNQYSSNVVYATKNNWLRFTIDHKRANGSVERYARLNLLNVFMSTQGATTEIKIERSTLSKPNEFTTFIDWTGGFSLWPGDIFVKHQDIMWGGNPANQGSQTDKIRISFRVIGGNTRGNYGVGNICYYGPNLYTGTTSLAKLDTLYSWDESQNVTFPARVAGEAPQDDKDLTTKKYVDDAIRALRAELGR